MNDVHYLIPRRFQSVHVHRRAITLIFISCEEALTVSASNNYYFGSGGYVEGVSNLFIVGGRGSKTA